MMLSQKITAIARKAKSASRTLALLSTRAKDNALISMAKGIVKDCDAILRANEKDIKNAQRNNLSCGMIDRLFLNKKRILSMADGLRQIAALKDEIGVITEIVKRPNGLWIGKMRVPIGVIAIIYESRPNVTSDCTGLTLKSGNSVILKGGSEAINSNIAISEVLNDAIKAAGLPEGTINIMRTTERKAVGMLLKQEGSIDLVIPRGGESLIKEVQAKSRIPVIKHYKGVCHVYVDEFADMDMARNIVINAKLQRPGVCNAMESLLVHERIAERFLPAIIGELRRSGVEIRGCRKTKKIIKDVKPAKESDWSAEYLDLILSVRVVSSVKEAVDHITRYGSMHSDAVITDNYKNAMEFLKRVDSACVYLNASTRFTDGGQFGMGAEIGISTDKLHARGPMGLRELTSYKYVIFGSGQVRI